MVLSQALVGAVASSGGVSAIDASGGTETDYTEDGTKYRSHRYTSSSTFVGSNAGAGLVDVFVVAGGASGGGYIPHSSSIRSSKSLNLHA